MAKSPETCLTENRAPQLNTANLGFGSLGCAAHEGVPDKLVANEAVRDNPSPIRHQFSEKDWSIPLAGVAYPCESRDQHQRPPDHLRTPSGEFVTAIVKCASLAAAGLAVLVILRFHHPEEMDRSGGGSQHASITHSRLLLGSCPDLDSIQSPLARLLPLLDILQAAIQCPSLSAYLASVATYSIVGLFHLARPPRFWGDFGLVAAGASVLASSWLSSRAVLVDGFVLGGFLSLVCCYLLEWLTRACRVPTCWADLETAKSAKGCCHATEMGELCRLERSSILTEKDMEMRGPAELEVCAVDGHLCERTI